MIKKLLFAYDGSSQADAVIEDLGQAGLPVQLEATVLCVADVWLPSHAPELSEDAASGVKESRRQALAAVKEARDLAEGAATRLHALFPKWTVQADSRGDSPPWAVVEYAKDWQADLVVVGAHSHSILQRLFLGSVAGKVLAEAPCSVRVSRPHARPKHQGLRVLVAVDGSSDSLEAVRAVAARRWPADLQCRIVAVIDSKLQTAAAYPNMRHESWTSEPVNDVKAWSTGMVAHMADLARDGRLSTETRIHEGDPKKVLLHEAEKWDADCIFLGARGLHHREHLHLGTLANAVASRAHCTVEIVRPGQNRSAEAEAK